MPNALNDSTKPDPAQIDVTQDSDVIFWSTQFNVTGYDVRKAVECVGCGVEDVRAHLQAVG